MPDMTATKAIVAAVGVIITALTGALADNVVDVSEIGELITVLIEAVVTVAAVYYIPNKTKNILPR